jgi:UDPglucose 6-dehydrogenase
MTLAPIMPDVRVGIVGVGAVGTAMSRMFPGAALYDEIKALGSRAEINACDVVFVSVPTPRAADGSSDSSIVENVIGWIAAPTVVIRSTVAVGTTRRLAMKYHKSLVFQPEYGPAETPDHPFNDLRNVRWIILGGERDACVRALRAWQGVYNSDVTVRFTSYEAAELAKYMENAYLALKVTFCNEFFEIADGVGVEYDELRELWLMDPRIGRSHTWVQPDSRGFAGRCLPKDLDAIITTAERIGVEPELLREVRRSNTKFRERVADTSPRKVGAPAD